MYTQAPDILQGQPPIHPVAPEKNSGLAIASLVCGVASFLLLLLTGIPAIICGHVALGKIKRSQGRLGGQGMAITGLILGYVSILLTLLVAALAAMATPVILKQQKIAQLTQSTSHAKQLFYLLIEYDQDCTKFPENLQQLEKEEYTQQLSEFSPSRGGDWIYFSGQSTSSPSGNMLLASPSAIDDKRVVLRVDGSVKQMLEADYQAALRAQQNP